MRAIRTSHRWLACFCFAAIGITGTATAYQGIGSHIRRDSDTPRNLRNNDPASAERAANAFARCVADNRSRLARGLLELEYRGEQQTERAGRFISGNEGCMREIGFQLRVDAPTLVGGMAEYFVRAVYGRYDYDALQSIAPDAVAGLGLSPRNLFEHIGQCVARRDPQAARSLVLTEPASDAEAEALEPITVQLSACIPADNTVQLSRRSLRSIVAVGLYRTVAAMVNRSEPEPELEPAN
jgi:hypothetical protein